ncbi:hypothetical protein EIP91_008968 [Steccherinum ochraceum]|uniref:Uncharacterized protein n=1 Tax=Steccherinum ochraceum TaxID=92696 RepID=A0A4R0RK69_9APHY|nr:hypothetical protein EIP91_008968 [Steccherinum ochraceum]
MSESTSMPKSTDTSQRMGKILRALLTCQRSSWEQGVAAQALLEWYLSPAELRSRISRSELLELMYGLAHDAIVRQAPDGRLAVCLNGTGSSDAGAVDPCAIGETGFCLLEAGLPEADQERFKAGIDKMLRYILEDCPRAPVSTAEAGPAETSLLSHRIDAVEIWSDTVYMLPPFLAASAVYAIRTQQGSPTDRLSRVRLSLEQIVLASEVLQSPSGAWYHIYSLDKREFKRKVLWGVGNGWVCAGITRVLWIYARAMEDGKTEGEMGKIFEDATVTELAKQCNVILKKTLLACSEHMLPNGLFHDILDDTSSFIETNLSQQLAYTLFRLLDLHAHTSPELKRRIPLFELDEASAEDRKQKAETMYQAAVAKTDTWGFVRDVCGSPRFNAAGTAAEGQAFGLLQEIARAEYYFREAGQGR